MNSSEVSTEFQSALVLTHRIVGSVTLLFNCLVCAVVLFDTDPRATSYRKYLFLLQLLSTIGDACVWVYSPFAQSNCFLIFADTAISKAIGMVPAMMIYFFGIAEIEAAYFMCVYYRRNKFLPHDAWFCFHGWKYAMVPIVSQICALFGVYNMYLLISVFATSIEEEIPEIVSWVKRKPSFLFVHTDRIKYATAIGVGFALLITCSIIVLMIVQLIFEIRRTRGNASVATRRYQSRAVFSLIMQGVVPGFLIVVPAVVFYSIGIISLSVGLDAFAGNTSASVISVLCLSVIATHGFAHSLTIVACSPAYRKTIYSLLMGARTLGRGRRAGSVKSKGKSSNSVHTRTGATAKQF